MSVRQRLPLKPARTRTLVPIEPLGGKLAEMLSGDAREKQRAGIPTSRAAQNIVGVYGNRPASRYHYRRLPRLLRGGLNLTATCNQTRIA